MRDNARKRVINNTYLTMFILKKIKRFSSIIKSFYRIYYFILFR